MKKLQKLDFSTFQFFRARGDISEMQQSTLADWCDLNTEAKKKIKNKKAPKKQASKYRTDNKGKPQEINGVKKGESRPNINPADKDNQDVHVQHLDR